MPHGKSRQAIIEAARIEFGEHGYAGARVSRIARRAGLNKQLIYYYFGSKSGLHTAATSHGPPVGLPAAGSQAPAPAVVRQTLARLLAALVERPDIVSLAVDPHPSPDAASLAQAWIQQATADVAAAVSHGQGMGYFRDDVDPESVARQALISCLGFVAVKRHLDVSTDAWLLGVGDTLLRATAW